MSVEPRSSREASLRPMRPPQMNPRRITLNPEVIATQSNLTPTKWRFDTPAEAPISPRILTHQEKMFMQTAQGTTLESLRSVASFLDANADKLGDVVKSGARQKLTNSITALSLYASDQTGGALAAQSATQRKQALRKALLRDHMLKIARIAKADLPNVPELEPLRMPKGKPTVEKLAAAASGMAKTAEPHSDVFIAAGLPNDFIAQLTAATDAMTTTISERTSSRGRQSGGTAGLKRQLSAGRRIVHVLDAFVKSQLKDDPVLLRNWNLVKRVPRPTRPASAATPSTPAAPEPTSAPSLSPIAV